MRASSGQNVAEVRRAASFACEALQISTTFFKSSATQKSIVKSSASGLSWCNPRERAMVWRTRFARRLLGQFLSDDIPGSQHGCAPAVSPSREPPSHFHLHCPSRSISWRTAMEPFEFPSRRSERGNNFRRFSN
jgi:hypothetical protein